MTDLQTTLQVTVLGAFLGVVEGLVKATRTLIFTSFEAFRVEKLRIFHLSLLLEVIFLYLLRACLHRRS